MKTADLKFYELCDEIDYWKSMAQKAEDDAEYWRGQYNLLSKESLLNAQKGVANALMFALSASDDENGNLVINKENRKQLAGKIK